MTLKTIAVLLLIASYGCNQSTEKLNDNTFVVPSDSLLLPRRIGNHPPPPPPIKEYYFPSNFIIDTAGHIYFYQQKIKSGWICGTGMNWDTPPSYIDLQPNDITEIPTPNLEKFIKANIKHLDSSDRQFAIASVNDTIISSGLKKIFSVFKDKSNRITWTFRRTTPEETIVLDYKKSRKKYYAGDIKWDSTKTFFPFEVDKTIKFIPPKAEEK
ncbi:MAG: hypothetical protein EOO43_26785 [Flavobacterium sp.]|nr:MAG: hypothetical protein EOO43_26785 [Flavobacterium sp.]